MGVLANIQQEIVGVLKKQFNLDQVQLRYPLPARPIRMLGLIGIDGEVYSTDKLLRVSCLRISPPVFMKVFSTYMCARIEYDLPSFLCEVVYMGKNIMVVLDVHRTADVAELERDKPFFDTLMDIRTRYSDLLAFQMEAKGRLAGFTDLDSRAACRLKITGAQEERTLKLIKEYLDAFVEYLTQSLALKGDALATARKNFKHYLEKVTDEDPGIKGYKLFFGKKEGVERGLEMFFGA
jgi:hypothetical protein